MSEYQKFIKNQPEEFQKLFIRDLKDITKNFTDEYNNSVSLSELETLDNQHIFNDLETNINE